ncbi:MAG TPA: MATE family efflux transporter [Candidatus Limivivens merdigallinarum]|uniref:MATE family efflux transporter n=1 Tax=Candidatus Limivivens merdigallinarum TaxID=2840859 RepID=A0A9D0ZWB3_9FIRM|nr:MATE family efflux transporter [Candidatus Limivivens merdigallinarum]
MKKRTASGNQITEGIIWKQLLLFFFPIVLGTFFQQLYNTADAIVVGRFVGKEALAAVGGSTGQIINLVVGFFVGLSSGATVVIAQFFGAKDEQNLSKSLHSAIAFSIVGGIVMSILGILLSPAILRLMNTPENVMADSTLYLRVYFGGILFVFLYNIGSGILRAVGDSKRPLYFLIICCFLNIFLDLLLVVVFHMGVAGVALGTLISQAVSAVLIIVTLCRSKEMYHLTLREIRFYRAPLLSLLRIGIPAGFQSVMYNLANVTIQSALNAFGTDAMAAWTAFGKIDSLFWMISGAFGTSVTTFVGQNYGAGKYDRIRKSVKVSLGMFFGTAIAISLIMITLGQYMFYLFTTDDTVIEIGMQILRLIVPAYATFVFIEIYSGALRAMGDVFIPMLMTCGGVCILRILWILVVVPMNSSIQTIMFSYPISWILTSILFFIYFHRKQGKLPAR